MPSSSKFLECTLNAVETTEGSLGTDNSVAYNMEWCYKQSYQINCRHLEGDAAIQQTAITILTLNLVCYLCRWPYTNTQIVKTDGGI